MTHYLATLVAVWAWWAGARAIALWWSATRQSAARMLAPGRPALRQDFDRATRHQILHGRSGLRRQCRRWPVPTLVVLAVAMVAAVVVVMAR